MGEFELDRRLETREVPPLDRLPEDGVDAVHEASMYILEHVGIRVDHEEALGVLASHGAEVDDDRVVTVPRGVVEGAVADAPSSFELRGRNPDATVEVGGGETLRAPGYGPSDVLSFEDGRRPARLSDYEDLVKLAHAEDVINCTGYHLCEPGDVDPAVKHVEMLRRSIEYSDQPLMASTYGEARAGACLEMVGAAVGDPDLRRPYVAGLVNTVPPRSLDAPTLGGLLTYAERGQPPVVSSFTMAGASGPATLAASIAQANAENLVGVALAQLVNPGTPVVYGVPSSTVDPRYGSLSIGSAESALFVSVAGQLGRYYDLPSRAGGGLTDAKTVDFQAGFESMLVQVATSFAGVDFVLHAAGVLESYSTVSPEKFVLDCETLRYLDRFERGYLLDEERFALDLLPEVEPAGHFLGEPHTETHAEREFLRPEVADKRSRGDWTADGAKSAVELGHDRVTERLAAYERPELDPDVRRDLDAVVERAVEAAS